MLQFHGERAKSSLAVCGAPGRNEQRGGCQGVRLVLGAQRPVDDPERAARWVAGAGEGGRTSKRRPGLSSRPACGWMDPLVGT